MPQPDPIRFRLTPCQRLRRPEDFKRVYDRKQRAGDHVLLLFAAPNELTHSRIGVSVGRKHGNSVVRHRIKRLVKEAFRISQHALPSGFDFVAVPRQGETPSLAEITRSLEQLAKRVTRSK